MFSPRKNADKSFASFHVYVCAAVLVSEREGGRGREGECGREREKRKGRCL
jgi:hypothetical protein